MYLKSLYLKNFRIYKEKVLTFSPRMNVIWGENASGKTTILEAIYYLIFGKSFRTEKVQDLCHENEKYFYIEAEFLKHGIVQTLKVSFDGKDRNFVYNHTKLQNGANLLGILQGVLLMPDDVELIKGDPLLRRRFFDMALAQIDPLYIHYLMRYKRAMQQRNCLLKAKAIKAIESFEHEMASSAAYIVRQRHLLVKEIEEESKGLHECLVGSQEAVKLHYKTAAGDFSNVKALKEFHIELFAKNRQRELDFGLTLAGPHKDDLQLYLNDRLARQFASEGQQRSLISSLRLSEWMRLKKTADVNPMMLIDDFGISLDKDRKDKCFKFLGNCRQVFLTTTCKDDVNSADASYIEIK